MSYSYSALFLLGHLVATGNGLPIRAWSWRTKV